MNMTPSRHLSGSCVRGTALASAFAAVCLLAAGCSSSGGSESGSDAAPAGQAGTPRLKVALITHSAPGDVFWELVQKGAQAAAAKDNIDLTYTNDPVATGQADLVRDAVADRVDGIAVTLAKPEAMKSAVGQAEAAGIPSSASTPVSTPGSRRASLSTSARTTVSRARPSATDWTATTPSTPCVSSTSRATSDWRRAAPV